MMGDKKFHIAIMSTWFPEPGSTSGIFVRDQADALIDAGNKVSVFMFKYYSPMAWLKKKLKGEVLSKWIPGRKIKPIACNFVNFIPSRFSANPLQTQKKAILNYAAQCFGNYIKTNGQPDVIHHHGVADFLYITMHLSKTFAIPYVITEHSMFIDKVDHFSPYETKEEQLEAIQKATVRTTVSNYYARFNESIFHVPFIMIPNMINNDFLNVPLPSLPKKTSPFYFLNIGALAQRKRQDILIEAFAKAFTGKPEVHLIIAGNGPLKEGLTELITSLNMQKQIQLAGFKERDEILKLLDTTHVTVISSEKESFSMAAAEALFRGNPVLTTRCGGPEDFINAQNGLICNLNDSKDMAEKLSAIYTNYSSFNHIQIANEAIERFSETKVAGMLEELYAKTVQAKS